MQKLQNLRGALELHNHINSFLFNTRFRRDSNNSDVEKGQNLRSRKARYAIVEYGNKATFYHPIVWNEFDETPEAILNGK
mmetsp:Transcript_41258/g.48161  ORF Transcript_41258/g.48161 Transcript_41258/m.48161 type:complete len:80 (+) Transcript_41258:301-540(+)